MSSIRRYLIIVLLSAITLVNFVAAIHGYSSSMDSAQQMFDDKLVQISDSLSLNIISNPTTIITKPVSWDLFPGKGLAFQIWQNQGLVSHSPNTSGIAIGKFEEGFITDNFNGFRWRIYSRHFVPATRNESAAAAAHYWIMVAERADHRFTLAESIVIDSILPIILCLPIIAVIVWFVVGRGLAPLNKLADELSNKRSDDLSPLQQSESTKELSQVISSANHLMSRLDNALLREKRFAANAAHELRTPISLLKVHAYNLKQNPDDKTGIAHIEQGTERLEHLVEQMLTLHRTSPEQFQDKLLPLDLTPLAQECIGETFDFIDSRNQSIELVAEDGAIVEGSEFALKAMLTNLILNASKYTPESGQIKVEIGRRFGQIELRVEDSGPGIPEEEQQQVFERFYRIGGDRHPTGVSGCGLGLSIVEHIVTLHKATIELDKSPTLKGLAVIVTFTGSNFGDVTG